MYVLTGFPSQPLEMMSLADLAMEITCWSEAMARPFGGEVVCFTSSVNVRSSGTKVKNRNQKG